jgi:hypothetical protein
MRYCRTCKGEIDIHIRGSACFCCDYCREIGHNVAANKIWLERVYVQRKASRNHQIVFGSKSRYNKPD